MDLSSDELALKLAQDHPRDPDAFRTRWDAAGAKLQQQLPPEFREAAGAEWARKGMGRLAPILRAKADNDLAEANAELVKGMNAYHTSAANAWRAGDKAAAAEFDQKFRETLNARTDLDPHKREAALIDYQHNMRRQAVLGDFDKSKSRGLGAAEHFIKSFADPQSHPDFDPDSRDKLTNEMSRDLGALRAERAVAAADLRDQARTALDLAQKGYGGPDQLDGLIERAGRLDPTLAANLAEAKSDIVYQADLAKLPPGQIAAEAARWKAQADEAGDVTAKAKAARRHQASMAVLAASAQALAADPLTHAARQGLIPADDFDPSNPDPAALQTRLSMRDNVAAYYGLARVPVLTEPQASRLAGAITQAPPEAKADIMANMESKYGKAWPDVMGQLVKHKLPTEYRVLAGMNAPNADIGVARVKLAEAYQVGETALKGAVDKDKVKNIDADLPGTLTALRDSLAHTPNGAALLQDYSGAVKMLALQYARNMDWEPALKKAADDVVLSQYDFIQDDGHNARAPAGAGDAITREAARMWGQIKPADLAPARAPANAGIAEADLRHAAWVSAARGKWVSNESDDGWLRLDANGNRVMRADGSRLEMPFARAGIGPR